MITIFIQMFGWRNGRADGPTDNQTPKGEDNMNYLNSLKKHKDTNKQIIQKSY